jgi:hypothetical protein
MPGQLRLAATSGCSWVGVGLLLGPTGPMEPVDERNGRDHALSRSGVRKLSGIGRISGQRLLADHVLARAKSGERMRGVVGIGGAHMDDVDSGVIEHLAYRGVRHVGTQPRPSMLGARCVYGLHAVV